MGEGASCESLLVHDHETIGIEKGKMKEVFALHDDYVDKGLETNE